MEESREILLKSLENSGVCVLNDVSSVRDLTPATLVSICGQSLNLIGKTPSFPTSLPDSSVADKFKLCTDIASAIKSLGYLADLSFHQVRIVKLTSFDFFIYLFRCLFPEKMRKSESIALPCRPQFTELEQLLGSVSLN